MSFDYEKSAATADRLLHKFGRAVTLNSKQLGSYDPETATASSIVNEQAGTGVLLEYSVKESGQRQASDSIIQIGDKKLLLSTVGIEYPPAPNDTVDVGDDTYTVIQVRTLAPAGTAVLYECQLRR